MPRVSKRGGFSDRNGIKPESVEIQLKKFDQRTRIQLQNLISELYGDIYSEELKYGYSGRNTQNFFKFVLGEIYAEPVNSQKIYKDTEIFKLINNTMLNDEYDDVLTLTEAIVQYWDDYLKGSNPSYYNEYVGYTDNSLFDYVNSIFEREYIGYRFIDEKIVPISDKHEVSAIREALENKYQPVREHIVKANTLLADRENPDYENSIKESISAVEAICEILTSTGGKEATLGSMLKKLEDKGIKIHPALKAAYSSLYGYTSDASGIRHAKNVGGKNSTFEEAKYMLVVCSAFVNYLIALEAK